jgi:hypothetical protein
MEGREADVKFLYEKIAQNERHAALTIFHGSEARSFPNWSIAKWLTRISTN